MKSKNRNASVSGTDARGRVHLAAGYRAMLPAANAEMYAPSDALADVELPLSVDMRSLMTKVEDQGQTSSCVANAVAGAYEYWIRRITGNSVDVSRLFVYYNARWRAGDQDKDCGSFIQMAMEGLGDFGVCGEQTWPFDTRLLKQQPNRASYQEARDLRVNARQQVPLDLDAWKQCLAEGFPIVFGCVLFESFDQCNQRGGVVPMPSPDEVTRESHGGHSMCCVGYSDVDQVFIVRNSWGSDWGDRGYCYMPYNYLMNPKFNDGDCWVFTPDDSLPLPEELWSNAQVPVVNRGRGVDFEINPFSVEEYEFIDFDFFESIETVEYFDEVLVDYSDCSESVEEESWEEFEDFSYEEAIEASDEEDEDDEDEDDSDEDEDDSDEDEDDSDEDEDDSDEDEDDSDEDEDDSDEDEDDSDEDEDDSDEDEDDSDEDEDDSDEDEDDSDEDEDDSEEDFDDEEDDSDDDDSDEEDFEEDDSGDEEDSSEEEAGEEDEEG